MTFNWIKNKLIHFKRKEVKTDIMGAISFFQRNYNLGDPERLWYTPSDKKIIFKDYFLYGLPSTKLKVKYV